jgi:hypothetical protein
VILKLFALLLSESIHEKPVRKVKRRNRAQYDDDEAGRRETRQDPCQQSEARNATIHGTLIFWVKNAIVPSNPNPPYHPKSF